MLLVEPNIFRRQQKFIICYLIVNIYNLKDYLPFFFFTKNMKFHWMEGIKYYLDFYHFSNFHKKLPFYYTGFIFFENYINLTNWCVTNHKKYLNTYLCYLIEVTLITFNITLIYYIFVVKFVISLVVFLNTWLRVYLDTTYFAENWKLIVKNTITK